eukprot:CAMPEP_0195521008 /NCGR_PEP_ID=MMETSP0794_2-20130614/17779_1 /TAXON_ID=515487 /ORGANISM="Stephanopyxis turris, Strain CCMP 815" /LENGTH=502 /DNA_ID=CAMNT_0040650467 /DNA_START=65 /DNA_END=1573 /DNA_ORIENTATION=-
MDRILSETAVSTIRNAIEQIYTLEKYVAPTLVLVPQALRDAMVSLSETTGQDVETVEYLLGLLVCYPLGIIMLMLPYGKVKHLFSFILGAFLLQFTIGIQWIHQLISSLVVYFMFLVFPRGFNKIAVPVFVMLYMTAGHLHRQFINYLGYDLDFTGPQMVLTMKLYSLAYNLFDGQELKKGNPGRATKKCSDFAVDKLPGLLEFLGYTFCFSNVLAGPAFEYKTYARACDGTLLYKADGTPKGKIPSNVWATLRPLLLSFVCLGIFVVGSAKFPLLDPDDPQNSNPVLLTDAILSLPWIKRYGYMWLSLLFVKPKYYFAWKNAEGANNTWYAGFEGFDEKGNVKGWENANNIDIVEFETAPNVRSASGAWNKKTAAWLSRYIYMRTGGSLVATYGLSAFWHGFYPGYYFFFLSVPILTQCERLGRKKLTPRFGNGKKWSPWGLVCIMCTSILLNYMVIPFQLLAFDWSLAIWKNHYFIGHILCFVFYVLTAYVVPTPKTKGA